MAVFTWSTPARTTTKTASGGSWHRVSGSVAVTATTGTATTSTATTIPGTYIPMGITHGYFSIYVTGKATDEAIAFGGMAVTPISAGTDAPYLIMFEGGTPAGGTTASDRGNIFQSAAIAGLPNVWPGTTMCLYVDGAGATTSTATVYYEVNLYSSVE